LPRKDSHFRHFGGYIFAILAVVCVCVCCFCFVDPTLGNRYGPGVIP